LLDTARSTYSVVLIITIVLSVFCFLYAYKKRRNPGAKYFIIMMISVVIYNAGYLCEINAQEFSQAFLWYNIEHIAAPIQPYLWLLISMDFTGTPPNEKRLLKRIALIHPILYYVGFFTNGIHHLYDVSYKFESNGYFPVIITEKGVLYDLVLVTGTLLAVLIIAIYLKSFLKKPRIFRNSYFIMILASLFPWFSEYFYQTPWNTLKLDYFPIALIISEMIYLYGIFRFRIMSTIPIAHGMVFNQSKEAILLVDLNDYIIDANSTFHKLFPNCIDKFNKNTLSSFLSANPDVKYSLEENHSSTFSLKNEGQIRHYSAETIDIIAENAVTIGTMLVISDITIFIENQKILEFATTKAIEKAESSEVAFLQAQINPHFLNNTLNLISSMVSRDPLKAKETIANLSDYLMSCYQFDVNEPMITLKEELNFIDIYVKIEKTRFMERLMVEILCEEIPAVKVPRLILQPLVENAIRHGVLKKLQGGTVSIIITRRETEISFMVEDDGIGISPERIPVLLQGSDKNQGVGIINIHKRLIKHYGKGLTINSTLDCGTSISFIIPTSADKEKSVEHDKCNCY